MGNLILESWFLRTRAIWEIRGIVLYPIACSSARMKSHSIWIEFKGERILKSLRDSQSLYILFRQSFTTISRKVSIFPLSETMKRRIHSNYANLEVSYSEPLTNRSNLFGHETSLEKWKSGSKTLNSAFWDRLIFDEQQALLQHFSRFYLSKWIDHHAPIDGFANKYLGGFWCNSRWINSFSIHVFSRGKWISMVLEKSILCKGHSFEFRNFGAEADSVILALGTGQLARWISRTDGRWAAGRDSDARAWPDSSFTPICLDASFSKGLRKGLANRTIHFRWKQAILAILESDFAPSKKKQSRKHYPESMDSRVFQMAKLSWESSVRIFSGPSCLT